MQDVYEILHLILELGMLIVAVLTLLLEIKKAPRKPTKHKRKR